MNCLVVQRRLLSAEHPEQPAADVKSHLAVCPSCRAWHRRLVQMEQQIPGLAIPSSTAKGLFLQRLVGASNGETNRPAIADPATLWRSHLIPGPKERALRKVSVAFALAASLLVFALAWWSWPHDQEQARLQERLHESLHADTPHERVLRLARLAEQVHGEARKLVTKGEARDRVENYDQRLELRALFYTRVVSEHLIAQARQLPPADRAAVLQQIAKSLSDAESEASRLVAQLEPTAPRSAASFRRIALASRKGERDLRALLNG